jgi:hypothetical protein
MKTTTVKEIKPKDASIIDDDSYIKDLLNDGSLYGSIKWDKINKKWVKVKDLNINC